MHLITVAVAAYNVEKYIAQMLDSIIAQTYPQLEILIVNDGSTDATLQICEAYDDPRIRIISKENGGLSTARQTALSEAKGDYLCMVDGDDVLHPHYVEHMYQAICKDDADICACEYQEFLETPQQAGRIIELSHGAEGGITVQRLESSFFDMVLQYKLADSWNKMYKTSFLRKTNITFFLDKRYNGTDLSFNHLVALHCPVYTVVHEVLLYYRLTPNSRVRRKNKDLQAGFQMIITRILEEAAALGYSQQVKEQIYLIYLDMIRRALADKYKEAKNYCDFAKKYATFRKKYIAYCQDNFSGLSTDKSSKGTKLFCMLMSQPVTLPVYLYFGLRQRHIHKTLAK